ncbi:MAG: catalase [Chloroflexota bacterium]|nr:catalase [Chloroflexota bacterium]
MDHTNRSNHDGVAADGLSKEQQLHQFQARPEGEYLTSDQGVRIPHTDDSLKAGERGPTLMEDFHMREKITHFDHERIPERVVHARGSGAHGYFQVYESMAEYTKAGFLTDPSRRTPVFVRFSTVLGSRGSADTVRDIRGFATKFYTDEGVYDLVGNNIPVFFIQDAIKFPDIIHAGKPEPHHEMPQAATAHDTFWDFISLVPESMHVVMWALSDRAIPRSYRMMDGFGVHTFRFVNAEGVARFVKFHWKPLLGVHSLVWDEAQQLAGKDPDYHRRDLWEAIQQGDYPEYEFGVQILEEADEFKFPFDVLDATKIWPEELVPVRRIGKMTLNRNPENFFAETEQVAFHTGHLVPGIDVTDDPLLQGRMFSYLDTQLSRLGGPNFAEIPINKSVAPVRNNQRDGMHRAQIDHGRTSYFPNSLGLGCPVLAPGSEGGYVHYPEHVEGQKVRRRSERFKDYFSQARLFFNSMSDPEKQHIIDAARFELGRVESPVVRERMIAIFDLVDRELATRVAERIGVLPPIGPGVEVRDASGVVLQRLEPPVEDGRWVEQSAALSQMNTVKGTIKSRRVAMLVAPGFDGIQLQAVKSALEAGGAHPEVISLGLGVVKAADGTPVPVDKSSQVAASVLYDAVYVPGGAASVALLAEMDEVTRFIVEAFKHGKAVGASGEAVQLLPSEVHGPGVIVGSDSSTPAAFAEQFAAAIGEHRFPEREGARGGIGASRR